jgi:hypothetical protein
MARFMNLGRVRGRFLSALGIPSACVCVASCGDEREPRYPPPVHVQPAPQNQTTGGPGPVPERQPIASSSPTAAFVDGRHLCVEEAGTQPEGPPVFAGCHNQPGYSYKLPPDQLMPCGPCGFRFDQERTQLERARNPVACCYQTLSPPRGRPLRDGARLVVADALRDDPGKYPEGYPRRDEPELAPGWQHELSHELDVGSLGPELRARLAAAWTDDALLEHASVASFAVFALELMRLGAPPDLLARAHRAALDEIAHAEVCFALASLYAASPIGPGRLAVPDRLARPLDLLALVDEVFEDGCVGETLGAIEARTAAAQTDDPTLRSVLERIASDEESHAELAWLTLGWLLEQDPSLRAHLERRLAELEARLDANLDALDADPELAANGRVDEPTRRDLARQSFAQIVRPCARALLDRISGTPRRNVRGLDTRSVTSAAS